MKRLPAIAFSTLILSGCSTYYDKSAVPDAAAALQQASEACKARAATHEIKTYSEMATCSLAADRAYYTAVKLKAMYKFEDYAANYQKLAALRDADRITDKRADNKADQYLRRFYSLCNCGPAQDKLGPFRAAATENSPDPGFVFTPGPPAASPF